MGGLPIFIGVTHMDLNLLTASLGDLFSLPALDHVEVSVYEDNLFAPKTSEHYKFRPDHLKVVIAFLFNAKRGDGFLVHGPHGSGKTTLIQETLGRLKWPTLEMAWSNTSDICDLVGRDRIAFGESKFEYGPLATAMKEGYALIINEVDRGHGGNLVGLNNVLDGSNLVIKETGEVIEPHERFRLFVTANSTGSGDRTGAYTGSVRKLDPAFLDRFWYMKLGYMGEQDEIDLFLRKYPQLSGTFVHRIVNFANETRQKSISATGDITMPLSTRSLDRLFNVAQGFGLTDPKTTTDVIPALNPAYLDRLPEDEREAVMVLLRMTFK